MKKRIVKFKRFIKLVQLRTAIYRISRELCIPISKDITMSLKHFIKNINEYGTLYIVHPYAIPRSSRLQECVNLLVHEIKRIGLDDINVRIDRNYNYRKSTMCISAKGEKRWDL